MRITNDCKAIEQALRMDEGSVKHVGNFLFEGTLNGHAVLICAEPEEDDQETLNVYSVEM